MRIHVGLIFGRRARSVKARGERPDGDRGLDAGTPPGYPLHVDLACNYSLPLMSLLASGGADVRWIKLSRRETLDQEMAAVGGLRPILLHTLAHLGSRKLPYDGIEWPGFVERLRAAGSPHVAAHLALYPGDLDYEPDTLAVRERVTAGIRELRARLAVPVLVENQPFYETHGTVRLAAEPEFITSVAEETGTGLLLDTAHVRVAAAHCGVDARDYLRRLPLHLVAEVHVSGPRVDPREGLRDMHQEMLEEDYAFLAEALERASPRILTLEYGGTGPQFESPARNSPFELERQLLRLERVAAGRAGA